MSKVILLAPTPPPVGGIAGWTVRMTNAKLKNGWQVEVVDEKINPDDNGSIPKDRTIFAEIRRCFRIWKDLKRALLDPEAAVVHSCIPSTTGALVREYICACITKRRKRKFIVHFRCTVPNTTKGSVGRYCLKKLCDKSDMIITLNSQTNKYLETITATPMQLIPNFISHRECDETISIRSTIERAVYVGKVIETKGAVDVIRLARKFPNIEFRLIGEASDDVLTHSELTGLTNVTFVGVKNREEVRSELLDADVFLFLSYFYGEGFSNALAEAMAVGLPCIVTDWAANKDMIGTEGGAVVAVKDVDAAAEALNAIMPADIRKKQSQANIRKVKTEYVDSVVLDQYVDVYERVAVQ